jgi:actin beta/gamma 1
MEKCCLVADEQGVQEGFAAAREQTYELPDGQVISLDAEAYDAPEALFNPRVELEAEERTGINDLVLSVAESVLAGGASKQLLHNVVLAGGVSEMRGFRDRVHQTLVAKYGDMAVKLPHSARERRPRHDVWTGGAIWAEFSTPESGWISHSEYEEHGASQVHAKFPPFSEFSGGSRTKAARD